MPAPIRRDDGTFGGSYGNGNINVPSADRRPARAPAASTEEHSNTVASAHDRFVDLQRSAAAAEAETNIPTSRPYHRRFENFHARTLSATDTLFRARPSQLDMEDKKQVFSNWVNEISDTYDMEPPEIRWDVSAAAGGGGFYRPSDHSMTLNPEHPSIVTLIHETRHALQRKGKGAPLVDEDLEVDARAWSLSLYHKTRPVLFERLVRQGRIFHITENDLSR